MSMRTLPRAGRLPAFAATLLIATVLSVGPARAAVPQPCGGVPQVSDVDGDGHHKRTDVLSAWFSEEAGRLQAAIEVHSPVWKPEHEDAELNGSGFAMIYGVGGQSFYVRARAWPSAGAPVVEYDYGTFANGSWFSTLGPTTGAIADESAGGAVTIDVPAATGAVAGALLTDPYVLTYDGITVGNPDWVDQAPGGTPPNNPARGADYVVGSCGARGPGGVSAVQLSAPQRVVGARTVTVSGKVVPAQAGIAVELISSGRGSKVTKLATDAGGAFSARLTVREATELRAVAGGIGSQTVTVAMKSKVTLKAHKRRSGAIRLTGRLDPALPGRVLLLPAGEIEPVRTKKTGGKRFALGFAPGRLAPGRYQVVYIPKAGLAARSTSNAIRIRP